jgi:hypothetical protein
LDCENPPPAEPVLPAQLLAQLVPVLADALAATAQNNWPVNASSFSVVIGYGGGFTQWNPGLPQPAAVKFSPPPPSQSGVVGVVNITLQETARCVGYAWQSAGLVLAPCGNGPTVQSPFLFQNIGTLNPNSELITLGCGFGLSTALVYQNPVGDPPSSAFFFDPRQSANCLRPVVLQPGSFSTSGATIAGLALHPGGYAAAVFLESSVLEIVKLAPTPVTDSQAPLSLAYAGPGSRAGLLPSPVDVAVAPAGVLLVLQAGLQALAAFDVGGNPVPIVNDSSILTLKHPHDVEPNESEHDRISLSFDIVLTSRPERGPGLHEFLMPPPTQWLKCRRAEES